jgi:phenylalanyl-tRNA synthetase beta chain
MKISYNWLKRYTDIDLPPEEVSVLLTNCGLEVESFERTESVKGGLKGVFIGKVMECIKHPNADKLSLTKVDIGIGRLLSVVCGAPNVAAGQKVPVATVGTMIYQGDKSFEIKEARIRGEFSEGMICAEDELGLGPLHEGIMVLDPTAVIGMPASEYFKLSEDTVFEIGLTPNRTDATSHTGVARDLAAVLNQHQNVKKYRMNWPAVDVFSIDDHSLNIPVIVEDDAMCPRYSGISISGIKIAESPEWLKNLLNAAGIRPINNIVDVTNFVMMELGQPLHAFDAAKIKGGRIIVRKARQDEPFVTLDGVGRKLSNEDLMICNAEEGMCIAGVFGGAFSGVSDSTTNIFLESACFNPRTIRKTSRYHALQTDSSFRFERGSDPNITVYALKRATLLIRELAGGKISSEIFDVYPVPVEPVKIIVRWKNIDRLIGKEIGHDNIRSILLDLGITIEKESTETLSLVVPTFKTDVTREADVIEEILRIYGYDNIEMRGQLRSSLSFANKPDPERIRNLVSDMLSSLGFNEIINNSLTRSKYAEESPGLDTANSVFLLNPLSQDLNVMRQTLLFGGLETIAWNQNRKTFDLKLYEFGRIYKLYPDKKDISQALDRYNEHEHLALWMTGRREAESWRTNDSKVDIFDLKAAVHSIFERIGFNPDRFTKSYFTDELFEEGTMFAANQVILVKFGRLKKKELKRFDLKQEVMYADFDWEKIIGLLSGNVVSYNEIPKFPEVRRDLALILDAAIKYEDLEHTAFQAEKHILKGVSLFDVYQGDKIGPGKKSYAISFLLMDDQKTLTDQIIDKTMEKILHAFQEKFHAAIR